MKIKKINLIGLLVFIVLVIFGLFKMNQGYLTPDEIFYTGTEKLSYDVAFKFYLTKIIFSKIYSINEFLLPLINIVVTLFVLRWFNNHFIKNVKRLSYKFLLLAFLLPSVIYFATAHLRDLYIFLAALFFFYSQDLKFWKKLLLVTILTTLRYEAGLLLIFVILIEKVINWKVVNKFNKYNIPVIIFFFWGFTILILQNNYVFNLLTEFISGYEKTTTGFSVYQLPITRENIILYSIPNWIAFWMPYSFKPISTSFEYFLLIDGIMVALLILRSFQNFRINTFQNDKIYRIATLYFLFTFFMSIPETLPSTIIRHHMAYLPALLYLNFPVKRVT